MKLIKFIIICTIDFVIGFGGILFWSLFIYCFMTKNTTVINEILSNSPKYLVVFSFLLSMYYCIPRKSFIHGVLNTKKNEKV